MDLKHYERYRTLLQVFAKACRLRIRYSHTREDSFVPTRNRVNIEKGQEESEEIAVILHELGHFLDYTTAPEKWTTELDKAYRMAYADKRMSPRNRRMVLACERRAWKYGRRLARQLKISLGRWYDEHEDACLKSYKE